MEPAITVELVALLSDFNVVEYLGISSIKSYLISKGVTADTIALHPDDVGALLEKLRRNQTSVVGFTVFCNIVNDVLKVAGIVKEHFPGIHICLGGPQVNRYAYEILRDNSFIDSVIEGEGEISFYELVGRLNAGCTLQGCLGVSFRNNGLIIQNEARPVIANLDILPLADRGIFSKHKKDFMYVSGGRGCLGHCTFCSEPSSSACRGNSRVRNRSPQHIVDEIEALQNRFKVDTFYFTESTFNDPGMAGREKAENVFREIIRRGLRVSLQIYTRAELVAPDTRQLYQLGRQAGLDCVYLGVEAGNSKDLKLYNKAATLEDNYRAIQILREEQLHVICGFIFFNPYSDWASLRQNAQFLYNCQMSMYLFLYISRLEILPQSAIAKKLKKDGLIPSDFSYWHNGYDYKFKIPAVGQLLNILKTKLNSAQYDIDNKICMQEKWIQRQYPERYGDCMQIFNRVHNIRYQRKEMNHQFFMSCLEQFEQDTPIDDLSTYAEKARLDVFDDEMIKLFFSLSKTIKKWDIKNGNC